MRVAKLTLEATLLLLLDAPARLEGELDDPLEVRVRDLHAAVGEQQLDEAAHRLVHRLDVAAAQCSAPEDAVLERRHATLAAQSIPAFTQEVADESEVVGQVLARI